MKIRFLLGSLVVIALFIASGLLLANDGGPSSAGGRTTTITVLTPNDAYTMIQKNKTNKDFVILDVRTPDEFASGHIEGAINVDYNSEGFKTDISKHDKNRTYLVYCRTGRRTRGAVKIMTEQGFSRIYLIKGDFIQWQAEHLPVVR